MFLKIHRKKCNGFQQKKLCKPTLLQSKLLLLSCELPLHLFLAWLDCSISILPADSVRGKANRVSERSRVRERSEYCGKSKRVSGASERANGRASDPVLQSGFLVRFWPTVCWRFRGWHVSKLIWAIPCLTQVILRPTRAIPRPTRAILRLLMNFSNSKPTRNSQSVGSSYTELLLYLENFF